jgi:esterase/lipase superfamily enzyme
MFGVGPNTASPTFGKSIVTIPLVHKTGELERPFSLWFIHFQENPARHVVIARLDTMSAQDFAAALDRDASNDGRQVLVFVHGFNTTFAEGLRQTAQLTFDLRFHGAPVLYSWPSDGRKLAFTADVNYALATRHHLEDFLRQLAAMPDVGTIHVIAHSLGSRPLVDALNDLAISGSDSVRRKLKTIILAAPEIPQIEYRQVATALAENPPNITLYASSRDKALDSAESLDRAFSGEQIPRMGDTRGGVFVAPGVDSIDASLVDTDFIGHHYFADTILPDMAALINRGESPDQRGLKRSGSYWVYPAATP